MRKRVLHIDSDTSSVKCLSFLSHSHRIQENRLVRIMDNGAPSPTNIFNRISQRFFAVVVTWHFTGHAAFVNFGLKSEHILSDAFRSPHFKLAVSTIQHDKYVSLSKRSVTIHLFTHNRFSLSCFTFQPDQGSSLSIRSPTVSNSIAIASDTT